MTYHHTQAAYLTITLGLAVAVTLALIADSATVFGMAALMTISTWTLFGSLTTSIDGAAVRVRFGPIGLIRRRVLLADITSATAVRNSLWHGFGVRYIWRGRLWNVWGLDAVELQLKDGSRFRIGTDEPQTLLNALRRSGVSDSAPRP